ncbi:hypothetical protein OE424_20550 [Pseudomonas aeruginosa]|uniref:hypothetical protein n=1 Tax=Pseudomonas aeruginosa TaxID=287 RepID=UPI001495A33A|nr:hypothetical protein [Pseudomonas aeruginosa]MCU9209407.1 hypothetical protein [Pseudomonas aeruginosa]HCE6121546.1 hypothetical protein [Pseudomonas aeruginosa]
MSIDWSKAPEGTTHYHIAEDINPWRKIEGTVAYEHYRGKWLRVNSFNEGCMPGYYVPIPRETWDGQGLPPVGVRVSVFDDGDLVYGHGESGEVIAHVEDCAVIRMSYGLGCFTAKNLRTPEQIAAEEREKAVGDMAMSIQGVPYQYPTLYALYDAGWRLTNKK